MLDVLTFTDPYSHLTSGTLILRCPLLSLYWAPEHTVASDGHLATDLTSDGLGDVNADYTEPTTSTPRPVTIAVLLKMKHWDSIRKRWNPDWELKGLVLEKDDQRGSGEDGYRRVGVFHSKYKEVEMLEERVTEGLVHII